MNVPRSTSSGRERALARAGDEVLAARGDLAEPEPVGAVDDGDDEAVVDRDSDADVDLVVEADAPVAPGGVRARVRVQRGRGRAHEQVGDADVAARAGSRATARQLASRLASTSRRR